MNVNLFGDDKIPWFYKSGMQATLFMALGGVYWIYEERIDKFLSGWRILILITLVAIVVSLSVFNNVIVKTALDQGTINLIGLIVVIITIIGLIRLCKMFKGIGVVNYLARHSLGIYFFCGAAPNVCAIMLKRFFPVSLALVLACWLLSITIAFIAVFFIDKYLPFMYDLRLLKRNK